MDFSFLFNPANNSNPARHPNPILDSAVPPSEMPHSMIPAFSIGTILLLAHAGHHHDTGLPDFAAHLFLGLQYLAAILIPAAALALFLRSKKSSKSQTTKKSQ
jgi:hypothetical protein